MLMGKNKDIMKLAKMMNEKSLIKIPVISHIIRCFDILLDDDQIQYL